MLISESWDLKSAPFQAFFISNMVTLLTPLLVAAKNSHTSEESFGQIGKCSKNLLQVNKVIKFFGGNSPWCNLVSGLVWKAITVVIYKIFLPTLSNQLIGEANQIWNNCPIKNHFPVALLYFQNPSTLNGLQKLPKHAYFNPQIDLNKKNWSLIILIQQRLKRKVT